MTDATGPGAAERVLTLDALAAELLLRRRDRSARPTVVGVDGRSAAGKTTLADRLAAVLPAAVVVHTDDVAWWHSFFGWTDLLREGVLLPARGLADVAYRPPAWDERGREGAVRVPPGTRVVVVEGVGATRRELDDLFDARVWVDTEPATAARRESDRVAAGTTDPDVSREWLAAEEEFLADQRPWERADVVVAGDPHRPLAPDEVLVRSVPVDETPTHSDPVLSPAHPDPVLSPAHPDPAFPALHARPARGWVNDPNGLARVDGRYHVFFQHQPDEPVHRDIRWGHVSSTDLVRWRHEPDALLPRPGGPDETGCWSGCLVDDHGTPTAVYSGVRGPGGRAEVLLATSDRTLRTFAQGDHGVAPFPDDPAVTEVRDPFVVTHAGHRYAVQGAGGPAGGARVLLHRCDDLEVWEPLGTLLDDRDPVAAALAPADVWECPNLFPLDGRWVLLLSLWRTVDGTTDLSGVTALVGDLEPVGDGWRFVPRTGGPLDGGPVFYAPQVLLDAGRVLLWGWAQEGGRPPADVAAAGWAGVLTFPRELSLAADGTVASRPAPELTVLRREPLTARTLRERSFEVVGTDPFDLVLLGPDGPRAVVAVRGPARVLVDGSVVEVFEDPLPRTLRIHPDADTRWEVRGPGADTAAVWRLG